MRRLPFVFSLASLAVLFAPVAHSEPTASLRERAQAVLAQIAQLDRGVEQVAEQYDAAGVQLAQTRRDLRINSRQFVVAQRNLKRGQKELARLLVIRYEEQEPSTLEILLGATSLTDVLDELDASQRVAAQDQRVVSQVRRYRENVLDRRRLLRRQLADRQALWEQLARQRSQVEQQLSQRRALVASIRGEVARLQAQERTRQERLKRAVEARLATQRAPEPATPPTASAPAAPTPSPTTTDSSAPPAATAGAGHPEVVPIAMRYLGVPYRWGGASPGTGFDCSGLVLYVYAQIGISLPHNAAMQFGTGTPVSRDELLPGDLVFFSDLGHGGIYIGGGQFIDAPKTGDVVKIENLNDPWWSASYVGARRL